MIPIEPYLTELSSIDPPILPGTDLRCERWFNLDIVSLQNSEFIHTANPAEFMAGFLLWTRSFHQVPAGSLPNNEAVLSKLAGGYNYQSASWKKIRTMALHGWALCSDNRLYHPMVTDAILEILHPTGKRGRK